MKNIVKAFLFLFVFLASCQPGRVYEKHIKMENLSWNRFRIIEFEVPVEDISVAYNIFLAIRHLSEIPYDVLVITSTMYTPSGEERSLDYEVVIRNDDGELLGEGLGNFWDLNYQLRENFIFLDEGICRFEFEIKMPWPETVGIMEVGLILEKSGAVRTK